MDRLRILPRVHEVVGLLFIIDYAVLAIWAYTLHRRRQPLPELQWRGLRLGAALIGVQIILGIAFVSDHMLPADPLHFLYAALVTATVAATELLRPTASLGRILREEGHFSEAGAYAILAGLGALFALRLAMTGLGMP